MSAHFYGEHASTVEVFHTYSPDTAVPVFGGVHGGPDMQYGQPTEQQARVLSLVNWLGRKNALTVSMVDDVLAADTCNTTDDIKPVEESIATGLSVASLFQQSDLVRHEYAIHYESDFVEPATELLAELREGPLPEGYRWNESKRKIITGSGKQRTSISVAGFAGIEDPDHPSCELLDAAWTLERLTKMAPTAINILDARFASQQQRVADLARIIPGFTQFYAKNYPVVTTYLVNEDGKLHNNFRTWNLTPA